MENTTIVVNISVPGKRPQIIENSNKKERKEKSLPLMRWHKKKKKKFDKLKQQFFLSFLFWLMTVKVSNKDSFRRKTNWFSVNYR